MTIPLRVLIVEDDDNDKLLLLAELQRIGYEPVWECVCTGGEMRAALDRGEWDMVICDYVLPGFSGIEALAIAREHDPDRPFVLVSGVLDDDVAVETLKLGAHDYVSKRNLQRLATVIERELRYAAARRDHRLAESALQESEAHYRSIFEHAALGIVRTAADGRFVQVNQKMSDFLGYSRDELLQMSFRELTHPEDLGRNLDLRARLMKGELDVYTNEKRYIRKDGTEVWGRLTVSAVRNAAGVIQATIAAVEDITERKLAESALRESEQRVFQIGHYDRLTQLPNQELFADRLQQSLAQAARNRWMTAVVCVDLSKFNLMRDALGFSIADRLLQEVSRRLNDCAPAADIVSRLGDHEFALILGNLAASQEAATLAKKLLEALGAPVNCDGNTQYVTAKIGIALYPDDGVDAEQLVRNAGSAMQSAGNADASGYRFYSADMNAQAKRRLDLENSLRLALERSEFELHYQPKVDLISGEVNGVEALLRWRRGADIVSPAEFIPMLEESGLIVPVGEWGLRQACAQLGAWRAAGLPDITVAVNLSARQLYQKGLPQTVRSIIEASGVDPKLIELELTESALISGADEAVDLLRQIKAVGVSLSIDDFGTGYSSLSYLKRFPIDTIKIDRAFISEIVSDPDDASITRAIITLAHNLKLKVIAEGVETEAQMEYLATNHCDGIQGYYFSRPLPADKCTELLQSRKRLPRSPGNATAAVRTILLVDDEENILMALKRLLRRDGYRVLTAGSATEGLKLLATHDVSVIISDQRMPEMTGVEFLSRVKEIHPATVRMVLSGYADLKSIADAINRGAIYRFLSKPWDDEELRGNIRDAFRHSELVRENDELNRKLNFANEQLLHANLELRQLLVEKSQQSENDRILLNIAQESMQHIPLPVLGIDEEGLVALANERAEAVLGNGSPLLGSFIDDALPHALAGCLDAGADGESRMVEVGGQRFEVKCQSLGRASKSRGRLVVMVPRETLQ